MYIWGTHIFKNSRSHLKIKCHHAKLSPWQHGTHDLCTPDVHYDLVFDAWQKLVPPPPKISRAALGCCSCTMHNKEFFLMDEWLKHGTDNAPPFNTTV